MITYTVEVRGGPGSGRYPKGSGDNHPEGADPSAPAPSSVDGGSGAENTNTPSAPKSEKEIIADRLKESLGVKSLRMKNTVNNMVAAEKLADVTDDLKERFPGFARATDSKASYVVKRVVIQDEEHVTARGLQSENALGCYSSTTKEMTLASDRSVKDSMGAPLMGMNSWVVDKSLEGTCRHELGHAYINRFPSATKDTWHKNIAPEHLPRAAATISKYSATNSAELFAESFSAYTSRGYHRGSLPSKIETFLDERLK